MKTRMMCFVLLMFMFLMSCNLLTNINTKTITPSEVIVSENRDVSGFTAIEFSTLGKVNIIQGDQESLNISGPDNLVPEILTNVRNSTLVIYNRENINIRPFENDNPLTFTIVVKDLTSLEVSGLGDVQLETLSTPRLVIDMSGAGNVVQNQITTEDLNIAISGLGGIEISGQAVNASIDISGAGSVSASDLQVQTADVTVSGLGGATLWVTNELTGNISGGGSVSYYGNPQTNTTASGIGQFKSLGSK